MPRRALIAAAAVLGAVALAGCGAEGVTSPTPETVIGTVSTTANQLPIVPATALKGNSTKGKAVFASAGCGGCHTLAAAHSSGTIGPNLDQLKPDYRTVTSQVTNGGGAMPAFKGTLSAKQIRDVAAYVSSVAGS